MWRGALLGLVVLSVGGMAPGADVKARGALNASALQAGRPAALAVAVDVPEGFHAQSNKPLDKGLIPLEVKVEGDSRIAVQAPLYPPGKVEQYRIGKLSVYTGRIVVYVPIQVKADAANGPVVLRGTVAYQLCDDATCYPPGEAAFEVNTKIVPPTDKVRKENEELFVGMAAYGGGGGAGGGSAGGGTGGTASTAKWSYPVALGIAMLAGLLFNVMPCVLPVLPLKAMGFYEAAQHSRARSAILGVVFSAGVISVFGVLALLVLVLKAVSWSELFALPWFAGAIALVLFVMGLGMFGLFTVSLPTGVYRFTPRHDTYLGNYLFGGFTAILSTPCTAPLFPALLTYALAQPLYARVPVMLMVGVGMALPYLVLSIFPEWARRFPRTGPWSELVKHMLGFMLIAVAVYFVGGYILPTHESRWLIVAVAAVASLYLLARTVQFSKSAGAVAAASVVAVVLSGATLVWTLRSMSAVEWQPYTPERLAAVRGSGKTVVVEFTANWCGNCQWIEATVYRDPAVVAAMAKGDVVALRADLTRRSANGWDLLKQLNPAGGIPLTAIYSPQRPRPTVLQSVYTSRDLLDAMKM